MKITASAIGIGAAMCMGMGLAGYIAFKDDTEGEILDNFGGSAFDFFKIMVVAHLILYIPVSFVVMRYSVVKVMYETRAELLPWTTHVILTLSLLVLLVLMVVALLASGLAGGEAFGLILNITGN